MLLECFSGTGSIGKVAREQFGMEVVGLDIMDNSTSPCSRPSIIVDILYWDFKSFEAPDVLWMSPPCETFSIMAASYHRQKGTLQPKSVDAMQGDQILKRTIQIINHFVKENPDMIWFMENPMGNMAKSALLKNLPSHTCHLVTYCKYGFKYRKPTHIWTNSADWMPTTSCCKASPCEHLVEGKHIVSIRDSSRPGPQTLKERYRIPHPLVVEMFKSI